MCYMIYEGNTKLNYIRYKEIVTSAYINMNLMAADDNNKRIQLFLQKNRIMQHVCETIMTHRILQHLV